MIFIVVCMCSFTVFGVTVQYSVEHMYDRHPQIDYQGMIEKLLRYMYFVLDEKMRLNYCI